MIMKSSIKLTNLASMILWFENFMIFTNFLFQSFFSSIIRKIRLFIQKSIPKDAIKTGMGNIMVVTKLGVLSILNAHNWIYKIHKQDSKNHAINIGADISYEYSHYAAGGAINEHGYKVNR